MQIKCKTRRPPGRPRHPAGRRLQENRELYLIMLPVLVMIFIFFYLPMFGLVIAFQDYVPGDPFFSFDGSTKWVGLQHFKTLFLLPVFPPAAEEHSDPESDEHSVRLLGAHRICPAAQ